MTVIHKIQHDKKNRIPIILLTSPSPMSPSQPLSSNSSSMMTQLH